MAVKLIALLTRKEGLTPDEFYEHWEQRHAPLILGTPELARHIVRYEQLRPSEHAAWMKMGHFDGVTIQWLEGPESMDAFIAEPKYAELIAPDERAFLDTDKLVVFVSDEPLVPLDGPAS
jgi:hypothetical protein